MLLSLIMSFMVFNDIFNNITVISWWSVLLVQETRVPGETHWLAASHWQTLSNNVVSSTLRHDRDLNSLYFSGDKLWFYSTGSCKSYFYTIMTTTALTKIWIIFQSHFIKFSCALGLAVIPVKLSSMIFVPILQKRPIRTLSLIYAEFWLDDFGVQMRKF